MHHFIPNSTLSLLIVATRQRLAINSFRSRAVAQISDRNGRTLSNDHCGRTENSNSNLKQKPSVAIRALTTERYETKKTNKNHWKNLRPIL